MQTILQRITKGLVYLTFFVPLVVVPSSFIFPFIVPKILLFRSLVILMLGSYVLLLLTNWENYKPRRSLLTIAVTGFFVSFALSTFGGADAYHSFWDNHERMLGLFTIAHYIIYFFICSAIFKTWTDWKWALRLFLLAGSVVMLIGILQRADPFLLLNQGSDRVASTLGNAIYVGGYGLFLFFTALLLILKDRSTVWRIIYAILGIMAIFGIFFSGTRGSLLGWLVGLMSAGLAYGFSLKNNARLRVVMGVGIVLVIATLGILYVHRQNPWVRSIPALGRLLNITWHGDTSSTRLIAWRIALTSWKKYPLVGWGPNNYFYAFNEFYNPHSLESGYGETWFDNAHNILLNTLAVQGMVGEIAYVAIFVLGIAIVWRMRILRERQIHFVIISTAFLIAHLVQNITVFENPTSYLYFMFWLAMINKLTVTFAEDEVNQVGSITVRSQTPSRPLGIGSLFIMGVACLGVIFIFNIQPARANIKTLDALTAFGTDPVSGFASMQAAINFNSPHIDDIRSDIARMIVDIVGRNYERLGKDRSKEFVEFTQTALEENVKLHPLDIRNYMSLAQLSQLMFALTADARHLLAAHQYLETALQYSPHRQQLLYMLASVKIQIGHKDEAVKLMEQAIQDDPKIGESYWRLAYLYYAIGDRTNAEATITRAQENKIIFDSQGQQVEALIKSTAPSGNNIKK